MNTLLADIFQPSLDIQFGPVPNEVVPRYTMDEAQENIKFCYSGFWP